MCLHKKYEHHFLGFLFYGKCFNASLKKNIFNNHLQNVGFKIYASIFENPDTKTLSNKAFTVTATNMIPIKCK